MGNGTSNTNRKNAHTLDWSGNAWFQGNVSVDGTPVNDNDLTTKSYVDEQINSINNVEVVSVPIVDGVLSLTLDKYQKTNMVSGTTIKFPTVTKFTEIHLYFDAEIDMELKFPDCKWRVEPNIESGKSYEVVCTYNTMNWLVNVIVYS